MNGLLKSSHWQQQKRRKEDLSDTHRNHLLLDLTNQTTVTLFATDRMGKNGQVPGQSSHQLELLLFTLLFLSTTPRWRHIVF
jgi:hypothetical protein